MENTGALTGIQARERKSAGKIKLQAGLDWIKRPDGHSFPGEDYVFHKEGCSLSTATPEKSQDFFARKGKSSSGSIRWQCKQCLKITNVKPGNLNRLSYNQKKSGIMFRLYREILAGRPVTEICDLLRINPKTYYHKLRLLADRLYRLKSHRENKSRELFSGRELFLATEFFPWERDGKKSVLAITVEGDTGYIIRADYASSFRSWAIFFDSILPAHLYLIQERFQPGFILQARPAYFAGELERAWNQLGIMHRWSFAGKGKPSVFMDAAGQRIAGSSGKYVPYYLDIYTYACSLFQGCGKKETVFSNLLPKGRLLETELSDSRPE